MNFENDNAKICLLIDEIRDDIKRLEKEFREFRNDVNAKFEDISRTIQSYREEQIRDSVRINSLYNLSKTNHSNGEMFKVFFFDVIKMMLAALIALGLSVNIS